MVRRIGPAVAAAVLLAGGIVVGGLTAPRLTVHAAAPQAGRDGYVFIPKVVNEADKARQHADLIRAVQQKYAIKGDFLQRTIQSQQSEIAQASGDRGVLERDLVQSRRELEDLEREARGEVEQLQRKLIALLYKDMSRAVAEIAKEHHLDAVHTYTASPDSAEPMQIHGLLAAPSAPLYVHPDSDFTVEVIKRMNVMFAAEGQ